MQIKVIQLNKTSQAKLLIYKNNLKIEETIAYIGINGMTYNKVEGDGKTPKGIFKLGLKFGIHERSAINLPQDTEYIQINENLYWVDDIKSKYYNKLVDIKKIKKIDWKSAEHLIDYPKQYEYAIEIKTNNKNIPGKGSAIFLHCSVDKPTLGCIAVNRKIMEKIYSNINQNDMINVM